jgi:glucan 1,3-beta-glucosidase
MNIYSQTVGAEAIIDAFVTKTPVFVRTSKASNGKLGGSLVLNNIHLVDVPVAVGVVGGAVVLPGGTKTIASWGQGNVYTGTDSMGKFVQGNIHAAHKPSVLLGGSGNILGKTHPQYADYSVSQFVSVRDHGAKGDGKTDDTAALRNIFQKVRSFETFNKRLTNVSFKFAGCKIIFFDAGTYIVSSTITIPAGARIVGEAWSVIAGSGHAFESQTKPQVVVRVGENNSEGVVEITDMLFTTVGPGMPSLCALAAVLTTCILSTWSNRGGVECTTTSWK